MERSEALRYLKNAKETLGKSSIEDNLYIDEKYVNQPSVPPILGS